VCAAILDKFPKKIADANIAATREAYLMVQEQLKEGHHA